MTTGLSQKFGGTQAAAPAAPQAFTLTQEQLNAMIANAVAQAIAQVAQVNVPVTQAQGETTPAADTHTIPPHLLDGRVTAKWLNSLPVRIQEKTWPEQTSLTERPSLGGITHELGVSVYRDDLQHAGKKNSPRKDLVVKFILDTVAQARMQGANGQARVAPSQAVDETDILAELGLAPTPAPQAAPKGANTVAADLQAKANEANARNARKHKAAHDHAAQWKRLNEWYAGEQAKIQADNRGKHLTKEAKKPAYMALQARYDQAKKDLAAKLGCETPCGCVTPGEKSHCSHAKGRRAIPNPEAKGGWSYDLSDEQAEKNRPNWLKNIYGN